MSQTVADIKPSYPLFRTSDYQEELAKKRTRVEECHDPARIEEVFRWSTSEEYQALNFKREALTINPAKACQPLGAVLCALGFEKTLVVYQLNIDEHVRLRLIQKSWSYR